ncbi:5-methylcytosine-specific restriction endonuclease system specificity protein McrC [Corynebacterium glutamicum]|uniref:5-methylcytosine-specific restriction endonuclease system specificity protein McrC n=1 Tax=Corynebacterium glutamicum TaxID=1718 RepID=UPI001B8CFF49|nr:5-methylcytosine-specific restriction endonuclease system specificity protein McrC [Corynebacterium glutamicum]
MITGPIVIRNIYVMMAYAFRTLNRENTEPISTEPFDHLHDLFAEILVRGINRQIKQGLHRDYIRHTGMLSTIRGRIDITGTVATCSTSRGRVVCEFDEYEPDTPHNRVLKSVIVLLVRHGEVAKRRREQLRKLLPYLEEVTLISPESIRWNTLTYHRANASYRLLLGVCELVVCGLLPAQGAGNMKLASWLSDDVMSSLYERFLREYYRFHHPDLSPKGSVLSWHYDHGSAFGAEQLPVMRTDLTLRKAGRTLIIDAKYYSQSMQSGMSGKETVHSAHLYQILAYAKNADVDQNGSVSGLLLYARTEAVKQPDLDVVIQGNRIGARTLDLNCPWSEISAELESIVRWLEDGAEYSRS